MRYVRKTVDKKATCWLCGNEFTVRVRKKDKLIMTKCYHSYLPKSFFLGWTYGYKDNDFHNDIEVYFKNRFWKVIGYTEIQREIFYYVRKLLFGWRKVQYWECKECLENDKQ